VANAGAIDSDLRAWLDAPLPSSLPAGQPTALFCRGACFHRRERLAGLELVVGGARYRPAAWRMPRMDVFRAVHPNADRSSAARGDPCSPEDPEMRSFRSGFWATLSLPALAACEAIEIAVDAQLASGARARAVLGRISGSDRATPVPPRRLGDGEGGDLISVCMTTFEPDLALFEAQIDSLRSQTDDRWRCVISDDCSSAERYAAIERIVGGDARFVVSRSERRLGFYRNFERALAMAPPEAELVALCDQDDRWYPDKLAALRRGLGDAELVYSDMRLVDASGEVLAESIWRGRRNNYENLASLLVANTVTGAAMLFRRRLLDVALPFPDQPGWQFHDHWLALAALATGTMVYVDRPLYDYVQHRGAILGHVMVEPEPEAGPRRPRRPFAGWRAAYFCAYLRQEAQAQTLLARCGDRIDDRKRRVLERFIAAQRSPLALAWLAVRRVRRLWGRNETLDGEGELIRGILWRHLVAIAAGRRERPGRLALDASMPACGPGGFSQPRQRRWRSRR
jgi:glycosyltransferase involved in cell wall biosynthesis